MAILNMKRIEILGLQKDRKNIIEFLQRQGSVQLDEMNEESGHFTNLPTASTVTQLEKYESLVDSAVEILDKYAPGKGSMLDSFAYRAQMSTSEFLDILAEVDTPFLKICQFVGNKGKTTYG